MKLFGKLGNKESTKIIFWKKIKIFEHNYLVMEQFVSGARQKGTVMVGHTQ